MERDIDLKEFEIIKTLCKLFRINLSNRQEKRYCDRAYQI